ncbi:MAG: hypothetical protein ACPGXY_05900, partial [Alphaproteobacteria bacterium]
KPRKVGVCVVIRDSPETARLSLHHKIIPDTYSNFTFLVLMPLLLNNWLIFDFSKIMLICYSVIICGGNMRLNIYFYTLFSLGLTPNNYF